MLVLGVETSCDETAAAVVEDGKHVRSNVVFSQVSAHQPYGGVVPEIASRAHVELLPQIAADAVEHAGVSWEALDAVAVTHGPGLASSLLVGVSFAMALALRLEKPVLGVNHLDAHLYSVFLDAASGGPDALCPMVVLLVTGGHTCLVRLDRVGGHRLLGETLDDAAGEALDKGANLLGLGYPGGPAIERASAGGDATAIRFPRGLEHGPADAHVGGLPRAHCFSFSGLKTALRYHLQNNPDALDGVKLADVAASYQEAVFDALLDRADRVLQQEDVRHFACVGGVARNVRLRTKLAALAEERQVAVHVAPPAYCTDNAAMIAALAGTGRPGAATPLRHADVHPNLRVGASGFKEGHP